MTIRNGAPSSQGGALAVIAAVLLLVLVPCAASARSLNDREKAALAATVKSFEVAMREYNFARVVQTLPPRFLAALARRFGVSPDDIVAAMTKSMKQTLESGVAKIESFGFDLGPALYKEAPNGTPYVLIPTQTVVSVSGRRVREKGHTVALLDEGQWYLLRIEGALQLQILREVYPEFGSVEIPSGSTEILNP
jgi:hypothetical protein